MTADFRPISGKKRKKLVAQCLRRRGKASAAVPRKGKKGCLSDGEASFLLCMEKKGRRKSVLLFIGKKAIMHIVCPAG